MSSFARASFDVAGYLACRPSYPPRIIDIVLTYHAQRGGRFERAVDVGCGPGFVALELAPHFDHVSGIDPARKMVDIGLQPELGNVAGQNSNRGGCTRIEYKVGSAEDLGAAGFAEQSLDLVVAAQAAHWFDHAKTWDQFAKYVRPGGTVAYIGYGELIFPHHPALSPRIAAHSRFFWAGGHWQAGRRVVEDLFDPIPFPSPSPTPSEQPTHASQELLSALPPLNETHLHPLSNAVEPPSAARTPSPSRQPDPAWDASSAVRLKADMTREGGRAQWLMEKRFSRANLEGYLRSWSALHQYHEKHPDDAVRRGRGANGDIIDRLMHDVWAGREEEGQRGDEGEGEILGAWPTVLMMMKRSQ